MRPLKHVGLLAGFAAIVMSNIAFASSQALIILGGGTNAFTETPVIPPAAYLFSSNGTVSSLLNASDFPDGGLIFSTAITIDGLSLIGGESFSGDLLPIAYQVSAQGNLKTLLNDANFPMGAIIESVSIADNGEGILGGQYNPNGGGPALGYLVSRNGTLTPITFQGDSGYSEHGFIDTVSIANSGKAVLGGQSDQSPTPLLSYSVETNAMALFLGPPPGDFPSGAGILSVSISDNGSALLGGVNYAGGPPLLYRLYPNGVYSNLSNLPGIPAEGSVNSVAIAGNGLGLVGGVSSTMPFACFVAQSGEITVLGNGVFPTGQIYSVAISNSGAGILGGQNGADAPIAYLVAPNGALTTLGKGIFPESGYIASVAIAESGVGIIGGQSSVGSQSGIAYLVAPNGALTSLAPEGGFPANMSVNSVALSDAIAPGSFGPYNSLANALFALTHTLENHYTGQKKFFKPTKTSEIAASDLLVSNATTAPDTKKCDRWNIWGGPFGALMYQDSKHAMPSFRDEIAGALAAADYNGIENVTIGGGLAYAFTYVHYKDGIGQSSINQEYGLIYADFSIPYFYFNAALWGGLYQMTNDRHTLGFITSTSHPHGWLLSPHVEMSSPILLTGGWFGLDPFFMVDWANTWQDSFHETGKSGLNISLNSQYSSLLRSEIGLRFFETINYGWGHLKIEQKASYVNKAPFHTGSGIASFVAGYSSFDVETFSSSVQNLGLAQIALHFTPSNQRYPYGSIDYQGEFGSSFQSHLLVLEVGKAF